MTPPDDFAVLILTHGRPERQITVNTLAEGGYTGPWYLVIDDEDPTADVYRALYGESRIIQFSKAEIAATFDEGDNFNDRRCIVYARNAAFKIAEDLGVRWFLQLDDDYDWFTYNFDDQFHRYLKRHSVNLNAAFTIMRDYLADTPQLTTIAFAQGGDFIGGGSSKMCRSVSTKRKAMNSFFCDTHRPFEFPGRLNEDVSLYSEQQRRGLTCLTIGQVYLHQLQSQTNEGGMTDIYLAQGTYVKSFYTVMRCPSAVDVAVFPGTEARLHHRVRSNAVAPKILNPEHQKPRP